MAQLKDPKLKSVEVTVIARNPLLDYLYAAGFADGRAGGVALVSLKNTLHAEKIYRYFFPPFSVFSNFFFFCFW